jgi:hypothetical protein
VAASRTNIHRQEGNPTASQSVIIVEYKKQHVEEKGIKTERNFVIYREFYSCLEYGHRDPSR